MVVWLIFILTVLPLAFLLNPSLKGTKMGNSLLFIIVFIVTYFSGFRDGLGVDYQNYLIKIDYSDHLTLLEPLFSILSIFVSNTIFSEIFVFLFFALITNFLYIKSFQRYNYFFIIFSAYILIPPLFFNSFNVIRQLCAAGIFLHSCKYMEERNLKKYIIYILFASTIHMSAIFLIPIYFFVTVNTNRYIAIILQIFSLTLTSFFITPIGNLLAQYNIYAHYLTYTEAVPTFGSLFIIFNISFFLLSILKSRLITGVRNDILYNLFFMCVLFLNISINFPILYRFTLYFYIFPFIALPLFNVYFYKNALTPILFFVYFLFFTSLIASDIENNKIIPSKILSPLSLFDDYYLNDKLKYLRR